MGEYLDTKMEILDIKNEISHIKLIISSLKLDMEYCSNKKKLAKLKNKQFYMERRVKQLTSQKNKLEKSHSLYCSAARKEDL